MSKEDSTILKGVAILLMLFLHLFNSLETAASCHNLISIAGLPLTHILTRASNPVPFYIILSGYGLYLSCKKTGYNIVSKIKKLYVHYWISLLIFIPIGIILFGAARYLNITDIICNISGYHTTWNATIWFLLPYALLAVTSKYIWKILDNSIPWIYISVTFVLNIVCSYMISRYGNIYIYANSWAYIPILYFQMIFPFSLGAYLFKSSPIGAGKKHTYLTNKRCLSWVVFILLVILRCCFETSAFHTLYVFAFIILFINLPRARWINCFLSEMGRHSTSMWFVHAYFYSIFFHDFIYSFHWPILIYLSLIITSYLSAIIIDWINAFVQKLVFK